MYSKDEHREDMKIATRSVCGKAMSYSLSVTMHVWNLRWPRFVARWNETGASILFYQPTQARGQASEDSGLTKGRQSTSGSLPADLYKDWRDAQHFSLDAKRKVVKP